MKRAFQSIVAAFVGSDDPNNFEQITDARMNDVPVAAMREER
jgi:hypothetical protein